VITNGADATPAIAVKSRCASKLTFCAYFAVVSWKIGVEIYV
jgi:hypothetical protein